jgi:hypothetical protein
MDEFRKYMERKYAKRDEARNADAPDEIQEKIDIESSVAKNCRSRQRE